jgi:putative component of membrane protein insertase Oxa1/YidC/SpoIIIJ protein YidD
MKRVAARHCFVDAQVLRAIAWYQRRLSPRKGWNCAHGKLHGGAGCSESVRQLVDEHGWRAARRLARRRFRECKLAAQILRAQSESARANLSSTKKPASRRRKRSDWCDGCDMS